MKILTIISLFTLASFFAKAEKCQRTGQFVGAGDVDVVGSVTLEVQEDGSVNLVLSADFVSDAGPDLDIYVGQTDRVDGLSVRLEPLGSLSGSQTYLLPPSIGLNDYSYVSIHCTRWNHYYGAAQLGASQGSCNALNVNESPESKHLKVNVSSSKVAIQSDKSYKNVAIKAYDLKGNLVMYQFVSEINIGSTAVVGVYPKTGILVVTGNEIIYSYKYSLN